MNIIKDLWAKSGTIYMPNVIPVPFWGYAESASIEPQLPGPVIEATVGDTLQINLHNMLNEPVSIIFPGQNVVPTPVKDIDDRFVSYTAHAPNNGDVVSYSYTADKPGIFLYESGSSPERQIQMGMYGIIIVRPAGFDVVNASTRTAYGINTGSEFDIEKVLVFGEIDSVLHSKIVNPQPDDMYVFRPDYWTINGRSYPHTIAADDNFSQPYSSKIMAGPGQKILIRCINAGFQHHNIRFDSLQIRVIGTDSVLLNSNTLDRTYKKNTVTIASGESYDIIVTINTPGMYMIYDRDYNHLVDINSLSGGMMTMIEIL
ncbi:MAG: multicopper oxidase domain-containing protein [Clostridia bacterium]